MTQRRFDELLQGFKSNQLSGPEYEELMTAVDTGAYDASVQEDILSALRRREQDARWTPDRETAVWNRLEPIIHQAPTEETSAKVVPLYRANQGRRIAVAAAVLLLLGVGTWIYVKQRAPQQAAITPSALSTNDVQPGGNKAVLTLSGGQQIILDSAHNGQLASQGGTNIIKLGSGRLTYHVSSPTNGQTKTQNSKFKIYNTLSTPRGGQYQLTLPDGTQVWLNAASSITYPTAFTGKERKVEITGEAYFEVAKNTQQPFSVVEKGMTIEVLGTHFNVNGYDDEAFSKTTLVEGKVKVGFDKVGALLEPGMQAQVYRGPNPDNQVPAIKVGPANVEQALAWKNGLFSFTDADLPTVMRQMARWYNVDVVYEGTIPKREFNGKIGRMLTLDQLLKVLATTTRFHYSIDGNKLTIQP